MAESKDDAVEDGKLNFIQVGLDSADSSTGRLKRDKKARAADQTSVEAASKEKSAESRPSRAPDSVQERFIQIGNKFYFPGGAEAFNREPGRLTTRSENAIVIQSMVAIARAESESGVVKVGGSDFFKKEAWFAASLAGLEVQGYVPTEFERERLVRAIASRQGAKLSDPEPQAPKEKPPSSNEIIAGRLVDHGPAPYQHNPKEPMSYFVRVETQRGDRDIWGVDLERAFRHSLSNPGIGDEIGIRSIGKEIVKVLAAIRDSRGQEIRREAPDTHKNHWSVERKDFLDQRRDMATVFSDPSISADEGIKRYAGLDGAYRQLESGADFAKEEYRSKLHRQQFIDHLRAHLAKGIENGLPLEPGRPPAREERTAEPRETDRDYYPGR